MRIAPRAIAGARGDAWNRIDAGQAMVMRRDTPMPRSTADPPVAGFTLIEALVCVAMVSLLLSLALPHFGRLLDRSRVDAATSDFLAAIAEARSQAVRRGQRIDLLPRIPGDWSSGWQVIVDADNDQRLDPDEIVLRPAGPVMGRLQVIATLTDGKRAYLAFDRSGRPRSAHSARQAQFGSLEFRCGSERRKLVISFLGRVRRCDPERALAAC